MTIYKYPLHVTDLQTIQLPQGSQILSVAIQNGTLCLWALVNPDAPHETRSIHIYGTGNPMQRQGGSRHFIGTVVVPDFVWHVFEWNRPDQNALTDAGVTIDPSHLEGGA